MTAALAAIAVGTASDLDQSQEENTASHIDQLRTYATGLIAYVLRQAGSPPDEPTLKEATDWLKANQKELQVDSKR